MRAQEAADPFSTSAPGHSKAGDPGDLQLPPAWPPCRHPWGMELCETHSRGGKKYLEVSLLSGSGSERCWFSIPHFQTPSFFSLGFTILPQFPSCHMLILELPGSETSRGLSPHVLFLHKGSLPRSDIVWDSTGLLESLGGRLTGLRTTTRPEGTVRWSHQAPRPTHGGPIPQP